jgi:release factor glutamine methyltransferase
MNEDLLLTELPPRRVLNKLAIRFVEIGLHVLGYYTLLRRPGSRLARAAGFELTVRPTVYDPRYHRAPLYFAEFIGGLDLSGKTVADLCTGTGIQALAACRAGAASVVAIDLNATAAVVAAANARANGFGDRVRAIASDLFSAITPHPHFDVIVTNPPFCDGPAWDVADRAWRAGKDYKGIASLFEQARERLASGGVVYIILSTQSNLELLSTFVARAGFTARIASQRRVFLETLIIYELRPAEREGKSPPHSAQ